MPVLTKGSVRDCFYLHIFYSEKFSTRVWRLPFTVNVNLNLSILHWNLCGMDGRTDGRPGGRAYSHVATKISQMHRLPNFLTHGASL